MTDAPDKPAKGMGTLRVSRHTGEAPYRNFGLWLDGQRLPQRLGYKEDSCCLTFPVTANVVHTFQARLDWERSKVYKFRVMPGQEAAFLLRFGRAFFVWHTTSETTGVDDATSAAEEECCSIL